MSVSVARLGCVYQSPVNGATSARRRSRSSSRDLVGAPEVQVDGALVHGRVRARGLGRAEQLARGDVDDREALGRGRAQRHLGGGIGAGPARHVAGRRPRRSRWPARAPRSCAGRRSSRSACASQRGPRNSRVRRATAGPRARRRAGARGRSAGSRGRGSPPRPGGRGTRRGGGRRTGRARPRRRRTPPARGPRARPARPHIWRSEATVPGNVTTTAASSAPMSMPELERVGRDDGAQLAAHQPAARARAAAAAV